MRALHLLALALMAAGSALLALGLPREGGELYFVVVFPVFVLRGPLTALGAALLFFGGFVGFFSLLSSVPERLAGPGLRPPEGEGPRSGEAWSGPRGAGEPTAPRKETKVGGVLLLGPVPIVFGSDVKVTVAMLILALLLTVLLVALYLA